MQFATLFLVHNPGKRAHPQNEIRPTQKDTNFGNAMFLRYLRPEKHQKSCPERHEFWKHHVSSLPEAREMPKILPRKTRILATPKFFATLSQKITKSNSERHKFCTKTALIDPSKNSRERIQFSRISHITLNALINPNHTNQTTTWEHLVACFLNCRPIVMHFDSSTLVQDAVLNCYKKPAHYYYHFSDFSEDQLHLV